MSFTNDDDSAPIGHMNALLGLREAARPRRLGTSGRAAFVGGMRRPTVPTCGLQVLFNKT